MSRDFDVDFFYENGYIVVEDAVDEKLIENYLTLWEQVNSDRPEGWSRLKTFTRSFNQYSEILAILCCGSIRSFFQSIDKDPVLHADITYSVSTQLDWHQDDVYSDDSSLDGYFGVWVALEDIHPNSGPISFIPGSHLWDLDLAKVSPAEVKQEYLPLFNKQRLQYYVDQISNRNSTEEFFIGKKGDILIWNGRLVHKGSTPLDKNLTRMSLIGHYSHYDGDVCRYNSGVLYALGD